ncbi:hypothetical protein GC174_15195 [bacterium]|nr:hypothetical protein [bacterium]
MSRDNTIAVLNENNTYRVAHIQAADNLYCTDQRFRKEYIEANFGDKTKYEKREDAWLEAARLYAETVERGDYVEYGVQEFNLTKIDQELNQSEGYNQDQDPYLKW